MDSFNHPVVSPPPVDGPLDLPVVPPSAPAQPPQRHIVTTFGSDVIGSLQSLMGTVVIAIFVITFIVQAFQIPSESMENTLLVGDYLLVNKLCYGGPGIGDQADAVSEDRARGHHRVPLSGGSAAALCEARNWRAWGSSADGEKEGLDQWQAPRRTLCAIPGARE